MSNRDKNDSAINENGELCCAVALYELMTQCGCRVVHDTVHNVYGIKGGRRATTDAAKGALQMVRSDAFRKLMIARNDISLINTYRAK
jgi:hypothetical protein